MTAADGRMLIGFILNDEAEDEESINIYLENSGIDYEAFRIEMLALLKKKRAEILIEKGKRFKEKFYSLLKNDTDISGCAEEKLNYAFRKLENLSKEDIIEMSKDEMKMRILKKIADVNGKDGKNV